MKQKRPDVLFLIAVVCLSVICTLTAQPTATHLKADDRFVRFINVIEPRLEKPWRTGIDIVASDKTIRKDMRSHEGTGYFPFKERDLRQPWKLTGTQFSTEHAALIFPSEIVEGGIFTTVFVFGKFTNDSKKINPIASVDKTTCDFGALLRFVSGIDSYAITVTANNQRIDFTTGGVAEQSVAAGEVTVVFSWIDAKKRQRKSSYRWDFKEHYVYTLILTDSGETAASPMITMFGDSEMAKDSVLSLSPTSAPAP